MVLSEFNNSWAAPEILSTASSNAASLALEGCVKPDSFLTNCNEASRTSFSVAGGSKLNRVLIFRHILFFASRTRFWRWGAALEFDKQF